MYILCTGVSWCSRLQGTSRTDSTGLLRWERTEVIGTLQKKKREKLFVCTGSLRRETRTDALNGVSTEAHQENGQAYALEVPNANARYHVRGNLQDVLVQPPGKIVQKKKEVPEGCVRDTYVSPTGMNGTRASKKSKKLFASTGCSRTN